MVEEKLLSLPVVSAVFERLKVSVAVEAGVKMKLLLEVMLFAEVK